MVRISSRAREAPGKNPPEKIPVFVLPCAIGFLFVGIAIGFFLARLLHLDPGSFLLRFAPLFTWATTFVLALYLGRRQPKQSAAHQEEGGAKGVLW